MFLSGEKKKKRTKYQGCQKSKIDILIHNCLIIDIFNFNAIQNMSQVCIYWQYMVICKDIDDKMGENHDCVETFDDFSMFISDSCQPNKLKYNYDICVAFGYWTKNLLI